MTDNANNNNDHKSFRQLMTDLTVSAAVQESKLDTVIDVLDKHVKSDEKWRCDMDKRMRDVEVNQGSLKTTVRNLATVNAVWASITGVAAAIFGPRV